MYLKWQILDKYFKKIVNQALKRNNDQRDNYWQVLQWSLKMLEDLVHCNLVLCIMCWQLGQYYTDNSINENNDESNALTAPTYQRGGTVNVVHFDNNKVTYNFWVSSNNFHDRISLHGTLRAKTKLKKIQSCAYRQHTGLIINKTSAKHFGKTTVSSARQRLGEFEFPQLQNPFALAALSHTTGLPSPELTLFLSLHFKKRLCSVERVAALEFLVS